MVEIRFAFPWWRSADWIRQQLENGIPVEIDIRHQRDVRVRAINSEMVRWKLKLDDTINRCRTREDAPKSVP